MNVISKLPATVSDFENRGFSCIEGGYGPLTHIYYVSTNMTSYPWEKFPADI